jgi:hypothetical protein
MKVKTIKLKYYTDLAHGWLRITRKDAAKLGILRSISPYSYQSNGGHVLYLEEDRDAQLVFDALKKSTEYLPQLANDKHEDRSQVRSLQHYRHEDHTTIYTKNHNLFEKLDKVEAFIHQYFPTYSIPRPCSEYPWGLEQFHTVLDNAREFIKGHTVFYCYHDVNGSLIATNSSLRMQTDQLKVSRNFVFEAVR